MAWVAEPWRLAVLATAAFVALAALAVLFVRPGARANRLLALVLGAEAVVLGCGEGLMYLTDDAASTFAFQIVAFAAGGALLALYPLFFSTLDVPWGRALRRPPVRRALLALAVGFPAFVILAPRRFVADVDPARAFGVWDIQPGPIFQSFFLAYALLYVAGLVVAIHAVRSATSPPRKRQARLYLLAFGWRDVILVSAFALIFSRAALPFPPSIFALLGYAGFVPLLAYAILRAQLFDIELKLKWTLRRGTVAAVFVAVFFAASEGAAALVEGRTGSTLVGIAAAALLVFAIAPLQRAAERLADAAMPRVQESPSYLAFRKMEVYKAALEGAMQDGEVSEREREVLRRLRASLGLPEEDAQALERDLAAAG